jgi:hypothetical protein
LNWYIAGALEDERRRGGNAQMEGDGRGRRGRRGL